MQRLFLVGLIVALAGCAPPPGSRSVPAGVTPAGSSPAPAAAITAPGPAASPGATSLPQPMPKAGGLRAAPSAVAAARSTAAMVSPIATPTPGELPAFSHVFVIVLENHEAGQIVGNQGMPYLNHLAAQYARAANYYGVSHPSLPNYLALIGGDTFGITTDCLGCFVNADNLAAQLEHANRSWKAYMEDMPQPCFTGPAAGNYAQRHDPFIYFDNIRNDPARCQKIVPLTQLQTDLTANQAPDFAWITPNVCNDMHDCPVTTGDIWLQTWVPRILASPAWEQGGVLFILFDEGTTSQGCCRYAEGGHVDALIISPLARPGFVSQVAYDHYSLLRTIEQSWKLPLLGHAASQDTAAMTDFFSR